MKLQGTCGRCTSPICGRGATVSPVEIISNAFGDLVDEDRFWKSYVDQLNGFGVTGGQTQWSPIGMRNVGM